MIDRYGEAIEVDLWEKGEDLLDYFRGARSWRRLRVIIEALPRMGSHYADALSQDDEVAEATLAERKRYEEQGLQAPARKWAPRVSEWSLAEELFAALFDRLGEVGTGVLNRGAKEKRKPPKRFPRPVTALDRAEERALAVYAASLDDDYAAAVANYEAARGKDVGPPLSGDPT